MQVLVYFLNPEFKDRVKISDFFFRYGAVVLVSHMLLLLALLEEVKGV